MDAPLEKQGLMAALEEFQKHSLHEGVSTQSKDDPIVKFARLVARQEGSRDSAVEPRGLHPLKAGRKGEGSWDHDSVDTFEALPRTGCAAIETEVKDARARTTKAASSKTATSNALPNSSDELKAPRHKAKAVVSNPISVANGVAASRRSLHARAGIVIVGLAGLGAGVAFWNNAFSLVGASASKTQTEWAKQPSQSASSLDTPAQDAAMVDPSPAAPASDHEQPFTAWQLRPTIASPGDGGLANQTASAPAPPTRTQMRIEPVGVTASPEPKKAEALLAAPPNGAIHRSNVPQRAAAKLLSRQGAAALEPSPGPKTAARTLKTAKPSVAAKLNNRNHPEQIVKPPETIAPETVAKPDSTQPPIAETEAPAPKPAATRESDESFGYLPPAQEVADSLPDVVKNWAGVDAASQP
jgi:hypothetical protein